MRDPVTNPVAGDVLQIAGDLYEIVASADPRWNSEDFVLANKVSILDHFDPADHMWAKSHWLSTVVDVQVMLRAEDRVSQNK